jgi:hypothetical protein
MKTVYVKNLAGEVIAISYEEGTIYEALIRSYPIPDKCMIKLFREEEELVQEPVDGEVLSILCQDPHFWVEMYDSGLAITSWANPYYHRYDIRIRSDSDQEEFGALAFSFYHREGEWVPSSAVNSLTDDYTEDEERIVIRDRTKCFSTPEKLFRMYTSADELIVFSREFQNPISRRILYEQMLYEWKSGRKKNYGVIFLRNSDDDYNSSDID